VNEQDDLIRDLIAEVARSHGVAISRDDPIVAVVLLNQIVLRRYLEETVAPAADAIRDATNDAVRQIEQFAEAQATWLEQVSLKDRASFLEEQKALHNAWKADMESLIQAQNKALRQVVMQTATLLRSQAPATTLRPTATDSPQVVAEPPPQSRRIVPWGWVSAGMLMGSGATVAVAVIAWFQLTGQ
jgi:AcrR family transcriptional regulator